LGSGQQTLVAPMARPSKFAALEHAYRVLGVLPNSSALEIRRAYRQLAKTWHPDRVAHDSPQQQRATQRMLEINEAFDLIKHAPLRFHVDAQPEVVTPPADWTWTSSSTPTSPTPVAYRSEPVPDFLEYVVRFVAGLLFGAFISFFGLFLRGNSLPLAFALPLLFAIGSTIFGDRFWYIILRVIWLWE
jgi:hypothetical protein